MSDYIERAYLLHLSQSEILIHTLLGTTSKRLNEPTSNLIIK